MEAEQYILSLLELPKIGRKSAWKIIQTRQAVPKSAAELFQQVSDSPGIPSVTKSNADTAWDEAERILSASKEIGIQVFACISDEFPDWLRSIPDPPPVLFVKGNPDCIKKPLSLAVVGTREPTDFGRKTAHRFGQRGAEAGCVVISGLALGCDSQAHRGCLDVNGKTAAVLAHGLDRVYPKDSQPLADEILDKGGCWISEYPPGMRAQRSYFVDRDRLQSGLAAGVIVVETDTDGGTMHTVRFAEKQERPIACLAHPEQHAGNDKCRGNALLIRENRATPLRDAEDLGRFMDTVRAVAHNRATVATTVEMQV